MAKQMDTTKQGIKHYLEAAKKDSNSPSFHAGEAMKLAFVRWLLDAANIADAKERAAIGQQAMATPGWFGSGNNSACRQAYESKGGEDPLKEYKF